MCYPKSRLIILRKVVSHEMSSISQYNCTCIAYSLMLWSFKTDGAL